MRPGRTFLTLSIIAALALPAFAAAATRTRRTRGTTKSLAKHVSKPLDRQRTIDDDRASEIQAALIRAGYLSGSPSGHWDADSIAAMTKVQADNGWQTKLVPDSRALIKLGLGPAGTASAAVDSSASIAATSTTTASR
jgi:hypothetical protein